MDGPTPEPPTRKLPTAEPEFPNLRKMRDFDRQQHIQKAMEMGMSREEAERHAEHDLADREESRP